MAIIIVITMAMHTKKMDKLSSKQTFNSRILEGLTGNMWGYGTRRIQVVAPDNQRHTYCPYSFTSMGFKNREGEVYVCLRMNIDQYSPLKKRRLLPTSDGYLLCGEMMGEFAMEYAKKNKQC
jgi:hypothetical protein